MWEISSACKKSQQLGQVLTKLSKIATRIFGLIGFPLLAGITNVPCSKPCTWTYQKPWGWVHHSLLRHRWTPCSCRVLRPLCAVVESGCGQSRDRYRLDLYCAWDSDYHPKIGQIITIHLIFHSFTKPNEINQSINYLINKASVGSTNQWISPFTQ